MAGNTVQLNLPTSTGALIHVDEVIISTVTGHVQRVKIGFGTGGVYTDTSTNSELPVRFVSAQSVNSTLQAGTATVGTVALQSGAAVALNAGTATIGTVNANLATGGAVSLKTSTGGVIPADTTSGLAVKFINAQQVSLATTQGIFLQTSTGGVIPATASCGLQVEPAPNHVESNNSTTSTLLASATFTGTGVDVLAFSAITIQIDSSHDSATDGMTFQFSIDNSNWDEVHNFTYTAANGARKFQFTNHAQYFRFVYTNGGTDQTHFRVQAILHHGTPLTSIHRLVDDVDPDRSATLHKSVIIAQAAGTGNFVPVQATAAGNLKSAIEEFDTSLPAGTATMGTVNIQTATTLNTQLQAGTATVGTVFVGAGTATMGTVSIQTATTLNVALQAGTATIGTVNLPTTATLILNTAPALATGDRGPKTTNVTASGTTALVTAAGTNTSIYITGVILTNTATTAHRGALSDGTNRLKHNLAGGGGGLTFNFNPPWKMPGNTALNWVTTDAVDIDATIHFYTGAT